MWTGARPDRRTGAGHGARSCVPIVLAPADPVRHAHPVLELDVLAANLLALRSPLLREAGVPHAFTTRLDGGLDDRALAAVLGLPVHRLLRVRQVHGAAVHRAAPPGEERAGASSAASGVRDPGTQRAPGAQGVPLEREATSSTGVLPAPFLAEADGLVGDRPGDVLAVVAADCVPVLLASGDGAHVAAVHAGWRGLLAGVLPAALHALGGRASLAAIGPCLSPARFEVGPEVGRAFAAAGHARHVRPGRGDRLHVDLAAVARDQLAQGGVSAVDVTEHCTWDATWRLPAAAAVRHAPDPALSGAATPADDVARPLLYSFRRDVTHGGAPRTGRQLALIAPRGP